MEIRRITYEQYPRLLKQIHNPPKFIDLAGSPIPNDQYKFLCVVGSRKYTKYGEEACKYLIDGLRGYPIVIVSGLAIGIDSIAHEQAIKCGLHTISIPGSGLDETSLYPPSHINLAKKIVETGNTLISPFEKTQRSTLWTFPIRNRLMAGISHATIIIEGRVGSGTLITAKHAIEFNRDVLIVPGSIFSENSYGPHFLYKEGATPVTEAKDILTALNLEQSENTDKKALEKSEIPTKHQDINNLNTDEKKVLEQLFYSPQTSSSIIEKTRLSAIKVNIIISQLELMNLIINDNGIIKIKRY